MKIRKFSAVCALLIIAACDGGDGKTDTDAVTTCTAPAASAGADVTLNLGDAATLDGTASEWCAQTSDSLTFTWGFLQTPTDSVIDETSLSDNRTNTAITPVFTPDVEGDYVLSLGLTDDNGESSEDIVVISVVAGDEPPIADCDGPYEGIVGTAVTIDGSNAYDPENADLEYSWSLNSPDCSRLTSEDLRNQGGSTPTLVPDCGGTFEVTMVVSDGGQWSDPAICVINVAGDDGVPIANAGTGGEMGACADNPLQLNGWASYDPDGDALTYQWSVISVPSSSAASDASFSDTTSPDPTFAWDVEGDYVLQLQVYDGESWSSPDILTISIAGLEDNRAPVANAGSDVEVEVTVTCTYEWTEASGSLLITNPYAAITTATIPAQAAEYGVVNSIQFEVDLAVADCDQSSNDQMTIFYSCEGEK
jgi:hypothetical protein